MPPKNNNPALIDVYFASRYVCHFITTSIDIHNIMIYSSAERIPLSLVTDLSQHALKYMLMLLWHVSNLPPYTQLNNSIGTYICHMQIERMECVSWVVFKNNRYFLKTIFFISDSILCINRIARK